MIRKLIFAGALGAFAISAPALAQAPAAVPAGAVQIEMDQITCKDFAGYDADTQNFIGNWMRGYWMSQKNLTVIQQRYVKRNTQKIARYCAKLPKTSLMTAIQKNSR
jgi:acid stress chaperone HdeB